MGIFSYKSNEEQFTDLIKSLHDLPKVKADDNFEYNLMIKIRNNDFSTNYEEKSFNYSRGLIPAAALAFSAIIMFVVISDSSVNFENPLLKEPPVRQTLVSGEADTIDIVSSQVPGEEEVAGTGTENTFQNDNISVSDPVLKAVVQPNDVVTSYEKEPYPFDQSRSLDLDSFVTGEKYSGDAERGVLVGGTSGFGGFLIREKASKEVIDSHKARMDSLKKSKTEEE